MKREPEDFISNWAGNYEYRAARVLFPESVEQAADLVARCRKVKCLGSRHSFNDIADSDGDQISLSKLPRVFELDHKRRTVTIDGGARFGDICERLHREGYALPNLASLPHISVAGACATGTHGSGDRNRCLSASVCAMEVIAGDGIRRTVSRGDEGFEGAAVGLGALGIVTRLTLELVPAFAMRQYVYENLPFEAAESRFDEITASAYSVSLFTDWQDRRFNEVWLKQRTEEGAPESPLFGATAATGPLHPIATQPADSCTEQMGAEGPWYERLTHFRMDHLPSSPSELQSEYSVPRKHAVAALRAIEGLRREIEPVLQISEVRTIAADDLWMSPCYGRESVAFHFTWIKDWPGVKALLPRLEEALSPFEPRPHWGKLFTMSPPRIQALYPRLGDFRQLVRSCDPDGKFRNAFLDAYLAPQD